MTIQSTTFSSKVTKGEISFEDIADYVEPRESAWLLPKKAKEK